MYVGAKEVASILGVSVERVRWLLKKDRIKGAYKISGTWVIPLTDGKPIITEACRGPKPKWGENRKTEVTKVYYDDRAGNKPRIKVDRKGKETVVGHEAIISGPCRIVYKPDKDNNPQVWIETMAQVDAILKKTKGN